ncbi:MAG TPA: response regulator transcription factor [Verrucomicrobia bacterium]|nr:response regulator transcription factor [Verrucomicrobiota bacterium]HOP97369.1 LytTR family DNA-binding domain-containing protein [Verrucomicrobiota bacterium]
MITSAPTLPERPSAAADARDTAGAAPLRVLIVDDQQIEREILDRMLRDEPNVRIIGACGGGYEAVRAIRHLQPDVVLLDVEMPDLDGFGVVAQTAEPAPAFVFVTANEDFARRAFDVRALDYLIKPCSRARLRLALDRAREMARPRAAGVGQQLSESLWDRIRSICRQPDRLAVTLGDRIVFVRLADIDRVEAMEGGCRICAGIVSHVARESMDVMEEKLPHERFLRISDEAIVNIERVRELHAMPNGEYTVVLQDNTHLTLTRAYRRKLQEMAL